jgi:outer membrane protein TolC
MRMFYLRKPKLPRTPPACKLAVRLGIALKLNPKTSLVILSATCLLGACATQTYEPRPLDAARTEANFRIRSLDNPKLQDYMTGQGYPQEALPVKTWGLRELTLVAFFFHPQLDVARAQRQTANAGIATAGQKQNPGISTSAEHHSRADSGISPWTLGFSFDIPIETGNKREIRIERATWLSEATRIEIGQSAWEIRSRLRSALVDYFAAEKQVELLKQEAAIRNEIVAMLDKRLIAGMISSIELANARLLLQKTQQALDAEKLRFPELRAAIAASAGLPVQALSSASLNAAGIDEILPAEKLPGDAVQRMAMLNRLDIRAALARYAASESTLKLEIAKQRPDIVLTPGYSFDQGDNRWSLGLSLILALLHKNDGAIAEANAQRETEATQFNALQVRIIGQQEQALAGYLATLEELANTERLLAGQQQRETQSQRLFEAGHIDRLEFAGSRLETLAIAQGLAGARIRLMQRQGALEDAIQRPLDETALPAVQE